ncbi:centromere-associated protein E-like [Protopterus annectens]|uniref:centromere-associated protein E-like n=1 Tax=Protopterus annectens TaxID=7888 RepID=UPI001CFB6CC3|nr:centromere-associated protein E-like [Protopterus annectens]
MGNYRLVSLTNLIRKAVERIIMDLNKDTEGNGKYFSVKKLISFLFFYSNTVLFDNPKTTVNVPLTCGGGSGIVQSTALLVLRSDKAKLQDEVKHLNKENERLTRIAHQLKADCSKWKERAYKLKESRSTHTLSSSYTSHDRVPMSPRRDQETVTPKELVPFSHNGHSSEETPTFQSPKSKIFDSNPESLARSGPTKFFDNSALGNIPALSPENERKGDIGQWFEKGKANNECKTQ